MCSMEPSQWEPGPESWEESAPLMDTYCRAYNIGLRNCRYHVEVYFRHLILQLQGDPGPSSGLIAAIRARIRVMCLTCSMSLGRREGTDVSKDKEPSEFSAASQRG